MSKNKINTNYFFVNRALLHSDRWLSEPFTRGQAWVDLFGLAQHSNGFFRVRGIKVNVERGQLAYSQVTLAKRWKWSRNKVRRYLKELENNKDVEQQNNEVTTTITILKYNDWQVSNTVSDTTNDTASDTTEGQQKDSKRNTYNKDKTVKNDKNVSTKEIYKEKYLDEVLLTKEEYKKLVDKFGETLTKDYIQRLDNYMGSKGKRYKSHYKTILMWADKNKPQQTKKGELEEL